MRGASWGLIIASISVLLVTGCVQGPIGPPVSTATVSPDAPQEGGDGDYAMTIRILDEPGGEPIPNAAIIVYWGSDDVNATGGFHVSGNAEGGSSGGSANGVVRLDTRPTTPKPDTTVPLRTGPNGEAIANVPETQVVGIVASATGHTEEWIPNAVTGESGGQGTVPVPIYKAQLTTTTNDTIGPAGASPGRVTGTNFDWYPQPVPWGDNDQAHAGYIERLASMRSTLSWTNGPTGGGDLSIGVGPTTSEPNFVQESDNPQTAPGQQTEQLQLDVDDINEYGWPDSRELYIGPATSTAYAAPLGLDYTLETQAHFDPFTDPSRTGGDAENQAPIPSLVPLLAAGLAALATRARWNG